MVLEVRIHGKVGNSENKQCFLALIFNGLAQSSIYSLGYWSNPHTLVLHRYEKPMANIGKLWVYSFILPPLFSKPARFGSGSPGHKYLIANQFVIYSLSIPEWLYTSAITPTMQCRSFKYQPLTPCNPCRGPLLRRTFALPMAKSPTAGPGEDGHRKKEGNSKSWRDWYQKWLKFRQWKDWYKSIQQADFNV